MFEKLKLKMETITVVMALLAIGLVYTMIITNDRLQPWLLGGILVAWIILRERLE